MLDLHGRKAVVVGAGAVGLRNARALAAAGAEVTVVTRDPPAGELPPAAAAAREYDEELLTGAMLVFACTDDAALNARVAADARRAGALVNVADAPAECDFYLPAVATAGEVVVAVGTGGASPALCGALRDRLARALPARVGEFAAALASARAALRAAEADPARRMDALRRLAGDDVYRRFLREGEQAVRDELDRLTRGT
jgi:siroheme synthase-like protein